MELTSFRRHFKKFTFHASDNQNRQWLSFLLWWCRVPNYESSIIWLLCQHKLDEVGQRIRVRRQLLWCNNNFQSNCKSNKLINKQNIRALFPVCRSIFPHHICVSIFESICWLYLERVRPSEKLKQLWYRQ